MLQQKVDIALERYLIPDLANFVLEYCWPADENIYNTCLYGNYEGMRNFFLSKKNKNVNLPIIPTPANPSFAGVNALSANTIGSNNVAVGYSALSANTTGSNNVAVGYSTLSANTTGSNNVAVGYSALLANTNGGSMSFSSNAFRLTTPKENDINGACIGGYIKMVEFVVAFHDGRLTKSDANEALYHACTARYEEIVELLVKKGRVYHCVCDCVEKCLYLKYIKGESLLSNLVRSLTRWNEN